MIDRLGNVLYWLACICAAAVFAGGALIILGDKPANPMAGLAAVAVAAFAVWLIGRAIRYVLSNR